MSTLPIRYLELAALAADKPHFIRCVLALNILICLLALYASGEAGRGSGKEMSVIASHLVNGLGYLSPYVDPALNIETTVCAPLYVWIIAGFYKIFGTESYSARVTLQVVNILLNACTLYVVYSYVRRIISARVAAVFGVLYCIHPHIIYLPYNVWETSLTTFLLSLILYIATFELAQLNTTGKIAFGILLGLTSLSNPTWTISYPIVCLVPYIVSRDKFEIGKTSKSVTAIFVGFLIIVSPWVYRNYEVTGEFVFVRGMAGPEFFKGNNNQANGGHGHGFVNYYLLTSETEQEKMSAIGEVAYNKAMLDKAKYLISQNPSRYLELTARRILMWWTGDIDAIAWYRDISEGKGSALSHYYYLGVLLAITGSITSIFAITGIFLLRYHLQKLWCALTFMLVLPIPFYLMIVGFRYQSALSPFLLIPASYGAYRIIVYFLKRSKEYYISATR